MMARNNGFRLKTRQEMSRKTVSVGSQITTQESGTYVIKRGWRCISLPAEECPHLRRKALDGRPDFRGPQVGMKMPRCIRARRPLLPTEGICAFVPENHSSDGDAL